MEPCQSSSILHENFEFMFKNTADAPVSVDDDDFVSPPPGVHKVGSKEGVTD